MKHLITLENWSSTAILDILDLADRIKARPADYREAMQRKTLMMIFEKPSLRTRVSFEMGMQHLGGYAFYLSPQEVGLGINNLGNALYAEAANSAFVRPEAGRHVVLSVRSSF